MALGCVSEEELYELGWWLGVSGSLLPALPSTQNCHVLRVLWDHVGFVGRNSGRYPVASVVVQVRTLLDGAP
ncbi:MAG: hypothetical protein M3506_09460 [Chloroflexota bacterium]|nr:hypothetical protein [Chloroflexota bacterium]